MDKLERALKNYEQRLRTGPLLVHATNACYDHCAHCYMNAVPQDSPNARYVNADDMLHFIGILRQDNPEYTVGLSGGDALLHPEIVRILDSLSAHSQFEIKTSGFALTSRNTKNRKELFEAVARSKAWVHAAQPGEQYHSITRGDIQDIRQYAEEQGISTKNLGLPSRPNSFIRTKLAAHKGVWWAAIAAFIYSRSLNEELFYEINPVGRAKNLPQKDVAPGKRTCLDYERSREIEVNYDGKLQYCVYACHDGFMNIRELAGVEDKEEAVKLILQKLFDDPTFQDMAEYDRCYFSKKVRKKELGCGNQASLASSIM